MNRLFWISGDGSIETRDAPNWLGTHMEESLKTWVIHVLPCSDMHVNPIQADIGPETFRNDAHFQKLTDWIDRELSVLFGVSQDSPQDRNQIVRDVIIAVLQRHEIRSQEAIDIISEYLFDDTELFLHELINFAKSPFSMNAYDGIVQYE